MELNQGVYRSKTTQQFKKRMQYAEDLFAALPVYGVTPEIAKLAGKISGEQMERGVQVDVADLLIAATALHLGFSVATLNTRHFALIPNLTLMSYSGL
jgi:predicted nucleic acid-binding protein